MRGRSSFRVFFHPGEQPSVEDPAGEYPHVVTQSGGGKALVVQDYAFGKYLGYLNVAFDNNGQVKNWTGNPILLDSSVPKGRFAKMMYCSFIDKGLFIPATS